MIDIKDIDLNYHIIGKKNKPIMLFISGFMIPWQCFENIIDYFSKDYCVVVPVLGGHTQDKYTKFNSIDRECDFISKILDKEGVTEVKLAIGISLGGTVLYELKRKDTRINKIIIDGAPLAGYGNVMRYGLLSIYKIVLFFSKQESKISSIAFEWLFKSKKYTKNFFDMSHYIRIRDVRNIIDAMGNNYLTEIEHLENNKDVYIYGTRFYELISKKSVKKLKKEGFTGIHKNKGDFHCESVIRRPEKWIEDVNKYI